MSDIPRFTIVDGQEYPDPEGRWVFINDHVVAVAEAEQRGRESERDKERWYLSQQDQDDLKEQGQRDALGKAVAAVEALLSKYPKPNGVLYADDVIAAIEGVK